MQMGTVQMSLWSFNGFVLPYSKLDFLIRTQCTKNAKYVCTKSGTCLLACLLHYLKNSDIEFRTLC